MPDDLISEIDQREAGAIDGVEAPGGPAEWQTQELTLLHRVRSAISRDTDLKEIYRNVVEQVQEVFGYTHVSLYTVDDAMLQLQHQVGYESVIERIPLERGVAGRVARTGQPVLIRDVSRDSAFLAAIPGIQSEICVPIFREGAVAGILNVETAGERELYERDLRMITAVSAYLNIAVERAALHSAKVATEERLQIALEAAQMGAWEWYPTAGEVHWSEQMAQLYGLPFGTTSITTDQWLRLIHPDDLEAVKRSDRNFLQYDEEYELEFRIVLPSGAVRWLSGKGRVVKRGPDGEVLAAVGVTMDITGRKRLEEERVRLAQAEAERAKAREAQRQITRTLERMTAGFAAVDRAWHFTFLNRRAVSMLDRPDEELIGKVIWELFPELAGSELEKRLLEADRTQLAATFDFRWPGLNRWLEVHVYPDVEGHSIYLQDVTEQRRAREERRRVEDRFRAVVQNASDVIVILESTGKVKYISPAVERILGLHPDELLGSDNFMRAHPQDAKRLRRAFVQVAKKPGVSPPTVLRFRHKDGEYRWLEITAANLIDDPAVEGIVANCRDVTERYQVEYNLWFLAETSSVLGASLDPDKTLANLSRLIVMNLCDLCIVDLVDQDVVTASSVGHRNGDVERELERARRRHQLDLEVETGPSRALTTGSSQLHSTITSGAGAMLFGESVDDRDAAWLGLRSAVIVPLVARGERIGVLTIGSQTPGRFGEADLGLVEELGRRAALAIDNALLYRAARAAIEARDQFLSVAAHELRTPITAISGFASLLDRELAQRNNPERTFKFVRRLKDAAGRLALLVDDLLDVSNIRRGSLPLRLDRLDPLELVERVRQQFEEPDIGRSVRLSLNALDDLPAIEGDEDRLEQVITNIVDNAVKYSPEHGEIAITLSQMDDGVLISVSDRGIGMDENDLETIFGPFSRAASAVEGHFPGIGIGLYICRNIVERHGGRIWAESRGVGAGTTLFVWLPRRVPTVDEEIVRAEAG